MIRWLLSMLCLLTVSCGSSSSPTSPRLDGAFADGQWRVGVDILPGRYYVNSSGDPCIWTRLRGTSGAPEDFIAGESLFFRTHQWIVDVLPTDVVFESIGCGVFYRAVRFSPQFPESISAGAYLVGSQVPPGTYRTTSVIGCRWARVRSFTSQAVDTIQGGVVSPFSITPPPSELIVTIEASDVGFKTYKECGTWQRAS